MAQVNRIQFHEAGWIKKGFFRRRWKFYCNTCGAVSAEWQVEFETVKLEATLHIERELMKQQLEIRKGKSNSGMDMPFAYYERRTNPGRNSKS